jgi:hypothetical protein
MCLIDELYKAPHLHTKQGKAKTEKKCALQCSHIDRGLVNYGPRWAYVNLDIQVGVKEKLI